MTRTENTIDSNQGRGDAERVVVRHLAPLVNGGTLTGVVYALITPEQRLLGKIHRDHPCPPLGIDTSFEIGSVTKVFTAVLLADMSGGGQVCLDDPISRWLPPDSLRRGSPLAAATLLDLATQHSGLPRIPAPLLWAGVTNRANPYAGYSLDKLYHALGRVRRPAPPGSRYRYSNFGFGVLGDILARAAGRPYADLLRERVCEPLKLGHTTLGPPAIGVAAARGHRRGRHVAPWDDLGVLAPAGGVYSTGRDMLRFLAANLRPAQTPLGDALEAAQRARRLVKGGPDSIGLAWHHRHTPPHDLIWHNGGTGGFSAIVVLNRATDTGLALLATTGPTLRMPLDRAALAIHTDLRP